MEVLNTTLCQNEGKVFTKPKTTKTEMSTRMHKGQTAFRYADLLLCDTPFLMKHPINLCMQCINALKLDRMMGKLRHLMAHWVDARTQWFLNQPYRAQYCWRVFLCQVSVGVQQLYENTALISLLLDMQGLCIGLCDVAIYSWIMWEFRFI